MGLMIENIRSNCFSQFKVVQRFFKVMPGLVNLDKLKMAILQEIWVHLLRGNIESLINGGGGQIKLILHKMNRSQPLQRQGFSRKILALLSNGQGIFKQVEGLGVIFFYQEFFAAT